MTFYLRKANKQFPEAETELIFRNKHFPLTHCRWLNFSIKLLKFFFNLIQKLLILVKPKFCCGHALAVLKKKKLTLISFLSILKPEH
jgi:hypothetical protein